MDPSLCLYKGKLKEALTLVPTMSPEKKVEAVAYWNDLAEQLQEIIHKSNPNYEQACLSQNLHVQTDDGHSDSLYIDSVECRNSVTIETNHPSTNVMLGLSPTTTTQSALVTPPMKHIPAGPYDRDNLLNKRIYENIYIDESEIINRGNDCKNHLPNLNTDNTNSVATSTPSLYAISHSGLTCSASTSQLDSTNCSNAQNGHAILQTDNLYNVMKHSDILSQVPNHQNTANKSVMNLSGIASEIYCSSVAEDAQIGSGSQLISMLSNDKLNFSPTAIDKTNQSNVETSSFNDALLSSSLSCQKSPVPISSDIGNGQFDRGPKLYNDISEFNNFDTSEQPASTLNQGTFAMPRDELYTQSERPLQQIQLYNLNSTDYLSQSYTLMNNRTKYIFCSTCGEQAETPLDLERHERTHTHIEDQPYSTVDEVDVNSIHSLDIKKEVSGNSDNNRSMSNSNNQHTCDVCGKSGFSTKGNLKRHLRAHSGEKPFKCDYCKSCFTEKKSLKIHVRRHTGEKPYQCHVCGKLFSQTGVLQSHMALHLNERKFECQKCGKAFRQRSQLKLHLMRHDGVKRLECSTCKAKFLTKGDLERHCRIHTGERPYACDICEKTFTRQQSLNEHMNRHTGRKPYDCKYCDKTFSEMSACYKHAKTHRRQAQLPQPIQNIPQICP